ncbi:MAG: hypothetical protein AB1Z55_00490 [Acidimicrobiia bacterium]
MDREALESLEWFVGFAEDLNREVAAATDDPIVAHAGVVLVLTFLAATGPVDRDRLTGFLDLLDVDATEILGMLSERGYVDASETDGGTVVVLTSSGYGLFETMADAVGGSMARSEDLARVRDRHLPR